MKKITYLGWKNCIELTSGKFRIVVTTEVGPRVIGAFYDGGDNLFHVDPTLAGTKGGDQWVNYGGHRLWHSPETKERTYEPDNGNSKVTVFELEDGGVSFVSETNPTTGITKTINIFPDASDSFRVEHVLRNDGVWEVEAAAWALSVMAPGGVAVVPQNNDPTALLPSTFLSVWPYTRMNDPRITWGDKFLLVKQDPEAATPMKVGFNCKEGWLSYVNKGVAFIKQFLYFEDEDYPDNGCSVEIYTNSAMLEAETLGPLCLLEPGDEIRHMESWSAIPVECDAIRTEADAAELFQLDDDGGDCCCECDCEDDECGCEDDECDCHAHAEKPAKKAAKKDSAKKKTAAKKAPAKKKTAAKK